MEKIKKDIGPALGEFLGRALSKLVLIAAKNGTDFSSERAAEYMKSTFRERFVDMVKTAFTEGKQADVLNKGMHGALSQRAINISIEHGATMYAQQIYDHAKEKQTEKQQAK